MFHAHGIVLPILLTRDPNILRDGPDIWPGAGGLSVAAGTPGVNGRVHTGDWSIVGGIRQWSAALSRRRPAALTQRSRPGDRD
jgi:hypothetical protein